MNQSTRSIPVRTPIERRQVVLGAAALLLTVVFAVAEASTRVSDSITFVYVVPVMLVSLELGTRAGIAAALAAFGLVCVWALTQVTPLSAGDLIIRACALIATAAITGRFSNRMQDARRSQRKLISSGLALAVRSAQTALPMLVACRALELVPARGVRVAIEGKEPAELGHLNGEMLEVALRSGETEIGTITIARPRTPALGQDQRLALEVLAGQAAVAAENERLVALEREQTALHIELRAAQGMLAEQGRRLELLFDTQEAERTVLAHELHEQAAQALAAVQLGLRAVEHDIRSGPSRAQVEYLRGCLAETLRTLRELAVGLRPPALDQLGLESALRDLAARSRKRSGRPISLTLDRIEQVPAAFETTVYRLLDDIIAALEGAIEIRVGLNHRGDEVLIEATQLGTASPTPISPQLLAAIRSRLDLIAGVLSFRDDGPRRLTAAIPLSSTYRGPAGSAVPHGPPAPPAPPPPPVPISSSRSSPSSLSSLSR